MNSGEGDRIRKLAAENGVQLDPNVNYDSNPMDGWNTHTQAVPEQSSNYGNSGLVTRISRGGEDVTGREDESGDISQMFESQEDAEQFDQVISDRIQNEVQQLDGEAKAPMIAEIAKMGHSAATDESFRRYWEEVPDNDPLGYSIPPTLVESLKPLFGEDLSVGDIAAYLKYNNLSQQDLNRVSQVLLGGNAAPPASNSAYTAPQQPNNYSAYDEDGDGDDDYGAEWSQDTNNDASSTFSDMQHREEVAAGLIDRFAARNHTTPEYIKEAIAYVFPQLPLEEQDNIINHPSTYMQPLLDKIERGWNKQRAAAKQPSRGASNNNADNKLYSWNKLKSLPQDRYQAAMKKLESKYGENWSAHVDFTR